MTVAITKMSIAEYLAYDDGSGRQVELVNGEIVPMPQGTGKHGGIIEFLNDEFRAEIKRSNLPWTSKDTKIAVQSPRGTRWETARVPDVVVLPSEQWEAMADREAFIPLNDPSPLLVVEVVSPSTIEIDYRTKHAEYAVLDIPEYWIVDPIELKVTICTLQAGAYSDRVFQGDETMTSGRSETLVSPTFPNLSLTATQVLRAGK